MIYTGPLINVGEMTNTGMISVLQVIISAIKILPGQPISFLHTIKTS
jgi:hypothetical protein